MDEALADSHDPSPARRRTQATAGVTQPVPPSTHKLKYRLFYGHEGERVVGYDNERGKGDHRHVRGREQRYRFVSGEKLIEDFLADVARERSES